LPSQHRHQPLSIRLSDRLRAWLVDYANRHDRAVRSIVVEALEEFRSRHEHEEGNSVMRTVTNESAKEYLRNAFTFNFLEPYKSTQAPISFPGIVFNSDGTLSEDMKVRGTRHFMGVLRHNGFVIRMSGDVDAETALNRVLWDRWTQDELGNGRFIGRLFDDYGRIYQGRNAVNAASDTLDRLAALGGELHSYTIQEDGPQTTG